MSLPALMVGIGASFPLTSSEGRWSKLSIGLIATSTILALHGLIRVLFRGAGAGWEEISIYLGAALVLAAWAAIASRGHAWAAAVVPLIGIVTVTLMIQADQRQRELWERHEREKEERTSDYTYEGDVVPPNSDSPNRLPPPLERTPPPASTSAVINEGNGQSMEWVEYRQSDGMYSLRMPGTPIVETSPELELAILEVGLHEVYGVAHSPAPLTGDDPRQLLHQSGRDLVSYLNSNDVQKKEMTRFGHPGLRLQGTIRDGQIHDVELILVGDTLYQLMALGPDTEAFRVKAKRFRESFALTNR